MFQHRGDKSELRGATPNFLPRVEISTLNPCESDYSQISQAFRNFLYPKKLLFKAACYFNQHLVLFFHLWKSLQTELIGITVVAPFVYRRTGLRLILHRSVYCLGHKFCLFEPQICFAPALGLRRFPSHNRTSLHDLRLNVKTIASTFSAPFGLSRSGCQPHLHRVKYNP